MNLIRSIKHQTLLIMVSLTLGVSLAFSSLAVVTAFIVEDMTLSNLLNELTLDYENYYKKNNTLPQSSFSFVQVYPNLDAVPEWAQERVSRQQLSGEIFTPNDKTHYHYHKLNLQGETAYLLAEVSALLVVSRQPFIFSLFLLGILFATLMAVLLAIKLSKPIVDPILELTHAVKLNENPKTYTPLPKLPFELGYLSTSLQTSFDKLNELLEKEKAFSTNVSHELRTPLTVLKNTCTLISQRGFKPQDLDEMEDACKQMEQTVDLLLALARQESMAIETCNVTILLEQAILRCQHSSLQNFDIQINIPQDFTLTANSTLFELMLINLLQNAAEHASQPLLMIQAENGWLIFENTTDNQSNIDFAQAGIKSNNSSGVGQGLYLVARIIEQFGWQFAIENSVSQFRVKIKPR